MRHTHVNGSTGKVCDLHNNRKCVVCVVHAYNGKTLNALPRKVPCVDYPKCVDLLEMCHVLRFIFFMLSREARIK